MLLRVNVFPGAQNLPLYAGLSQGIFERRGLEVDLQFTPNSQEQRTGLAAGKFEIAHAAVDNAVAMVELARQDVVIVMGGDSSMNEFFVRADVPSVGALELIWLPGTTRLRRRSAGLRSSRQPTPGSSG